MAISLAPRTAATAMWTLALGCGGVPAPSVPGSAPAPVVVVPLSGLYVLEMTGIPPEDTVVTFAAGTPRSIILRHPAPGDAPFSEIVFAAESFPAGDAGDSVTVTLTPRAGVYGLEVATSTPPRPGGVIRFKYPVHFAAPLEAVSRYGSIARLERALTIAYLREDGNCELLPSDRPAADNLQAPLERAGTYLIAAPR